MKPYPSYKDSGVEWVGEIPATWAVKPTFTVATENKSKNTDGKETNVLSLSYGRIVRRDVEENFGLLPESFNTYQVLEDGFIVLRLTDLQNDKRSLRVGLVKENGIITSAYIGLKFHDSDSNYIYRLFHAYDTRKVFYGMGGGLRQSLRFEEFRRLPVLLPPLPEQQAIAKFLDDKTQKIDRVISIKEKQIEHLKELRTAIINQAVTKGLDPNVPMKDSGIEWLGEIPKHWRIVSLKHLVEVKDGTHDTPKYVEPSDSSFPLVTSKDTKSGYIDFSETKHISKEDYQQINIRSNVFKGDLIMPMIGTVGQPVLVDTDKPFSIKNVALFKTSESKESTTFIRYFIGSQTVDTQFALLSRGGVQDFVSLGILQNLFSITPPLEEQQAIADYLDQKTAKIDQSIQANQKQINQLKEYRTALISEVVTGKVDVREAV